MRSRTEPRPETVLLVEDDAAYREAAQTLLEGAGYAVETAENGGDAVRKVHATRPDLVLLDLSMPVIDGFDALRALHALRAQPSRPHVIVLSSRDDAESRRRAFEFGCDQYIVKGSPRSDLVGAVDTLFWKRRGGVPRS